MAVYNLEEQETIDALKAWWKQYGNLVSMAVTAVCVVIIGYQGWNYYQGAQSREASVLYSAVSQAAQKNDLAKGKDAAEQLTKKYSGTAYAPRAALLVARLYLNANDRAAARVNLQWAVDQAREEELRQVARYRLATFLLDEKAYDEALRLLEAKHDPAFAGIYADLRGDILAAAGKTAEARAAYLEALAKLDAKSPYRQTVQLKLDASGEPQ
jgi:predicted negative regulator of RcsB-dependent stress response